MGNKDSTQNLQPKDLKDLKKSTKFTEKELKEWYKSFLQVRRHAHMTTPKQTSFLPTSAGFDDAPRTQTRGYRICTIWYFNSKL